MAALLKGQILKHLSKFTKNLSPDKLQLSALKGSCEVSNIELNEEILMDLLEVPLWMCVTKANCNHIAIKIQWMKLKTIPIHLSLDEVVIEIETCEQFRDRRINKSNSSTNNDSGKYGFTDRVFDGMTVTINSVVIRFKSLVFNASLQLSRLMIESRSPTWKRNVDLRLTRIKDQTRDQLLIFKHLEWQTLRLEAKAESNIVQTPLRLITNQASCRITIKKKLSDCSVLGARIMLIFDDLLWVLTDAQVLSALHFAKYLIELIKKAPQTRTLNDEQLLQTHSQTVSSVKNTNSIQSSSTAVGRLFSQYDIIETSHHVFVSRIEIHLCDDLDPNNGRSLHSSLKDGGALQITALKLVIDVYPYQKAIGNRKHWLRFAEPSSSRSHWIDQHLLQFAEKVNRKRYSNSSGIKPSIRSQTNSVLNHLMSKVVLIRLGDYSVSCVTTNTTSKSKLNEKLISTDKSAPLPDDMMAFYMEINNYYYFESNEMVPNSTAFVHLAPLKVCFDTTTLLWINAFQANLHKAMVKLQEMLPKLEENAKMYTRIECLMPIICFKCPEYFDWSTFEAKSARIVVLNCENEKSSIESLNNMLEQMGRSSFFYERHSFPWLDCDLNPISDEFFQSISKQKSEEECKECGELWTIKLEPFWLEFRSRKTNKLQPFLEPIPITIWLYDSALLQQSNAINTSDPDINLLLIIDSVVKVQISRNQYLFLMRFLEEISEFGVQMSSDTFSIQKDDSIFKKVSFITCIPKIEILLILSEDYQTFRSVGVSPQHSVADVSLTADEQFSLNSDINHISSQIENNEIINLPKSHSDSLLNESKSSFELNQFEKSQTSPTEDIIVHNLKSTNSLPKIHNISYKKGFSNLDALSAKSVSTLNESGISDTSPNDDDNRSIRSDISADSDQYVVVGFETMTVEDEDIFAIGKVDTAVEVKEDSVAEDSDTGSSNAIISNSDLPISVNLLDITLSDLNLVQQSHAFHSKLFLACSDIALTERIKIPFSNFLELTNQRIAQNEKIVPLNMHLNEDKSSVCLRMDSFAKFDIKDELMSINVNNIDITLHNDTLLQLSDFIVDEELTTVTPTNILLNNLSATLIDDKVRTPPLTINIPNSLIERSNKNHILMSALTSSNPKERNLKLLLHHLMLMERHEETKVNIDLNSKLLENNEINVLYDVLKANENLQKEVNRLKKENLELRGKIV